MTDRAIMISGALLVVVGIVTRIANRKKEVQITHINEDMDTDTSMTLGYRNNNPLNIRDLGIRWNGLVGSNKGFCVFSTMAYGYRAAMVNIRTSVNEYGCNTLSKIITRWAPPKENNTTSYINTVCDITGFSPNTYINPFSETQMTSLVYAMSIVENGRKIMPDAQAINQGWELYIS